MSNIPFVFVSYASDDRRIAADLTQALKAEGVSVWSDFDNLRAGDNWRSSITEALKKASALIVIATQKSSESSWVMQEVEMVDGLQQGIFPIVIGSWENMPPALQMWQGILLPDPPPFDELQRAAKQIANALRERMHLPNAPRARFEDLSEDLLREAKTVDAPNLDSVEGGAEAPSSIFLVHGHDEGALEEVKVFVQELGIRPVVLREADGPDKSLLQRFFRIAGEARFAVVIMSADDLGAARFQFEAPEVGDRSLQFRARQNVILELGFFYGQLGWDHVFVLLKQPNEVFPNFEMPSDIGGAVYDRMDNTGRWKHELKERLKGSGFLVKK